MLSGNRERIDLRSTLEEGAARMAANSGQKGAKTAAAMTEREAELERRNVELQRRMDGRIKQLTKQEDRANRQHVELMKWIKKLRSKQTEDMDVRQTTVTKRATPETGSDSEAEDKLARKAPKTKSPTKSTKEGGEADQESQKKAPSQNGTNQEYIQKPPATPKAPKIPPVVIRKQERWGAISERPGDRAPWGQANMQPAHQQSEGGIARTTAGRMAAASAVAGPEKRQLVERPETLRTKRNPISPIYGENGLVFTLRDKAEAFLDTPV